MTKKKILIFNGYYHPSQNYGGPIASIENVIDNCCDRYDFYIVCYDHDFGNDMPFKVDLNKWIRMKNANVMYVKNGYLDFSLKRMRLFLRDLKPNLIWFSGVLVPNNKIVAALAANSLRIPLLFSPRGELSADRVKIKAYKKLPYLKFINFFGFYKNAYFHATSRDEVEGINRFFKPKRNHIFEIANISMNKQSNEYGIEKKEGYLRLLFYSRIQEVKNLLFAIEKVIQCKQKIEFDIYGPIESKVYWEKCEKAIKMAPDNVKIRYCGILEGKDKNKVIQKHECLIFPTLNENYGHVIAETLANSRPVILSKDTTPWNDLDHKAGFVIPLCEGKKFTDVVDSIAKLNSEEFSNLTCNVSDYFDNKMKKDNAVIEHLNMFERIIQK